MGSAVDWGERPKFIPPSVGVPGGKRASPVLMQLPNNTASAFTPGRAIKAARQRRNRNGPLCQLTDDMTKDALRAKAEVERGWGENLWMKKLHLKGPPRLGFLHGDVPQLFEALWLGVSIGLASESQRSQKLFR